MPRIQLSAWPDSFEIVFVGCGNKMDIEVLVNDRYQCGEGPHWDDANNRLLFNDIFGQNVTVVNLETKEVSAKKSRGFESGWTYCGLSKEL